MDCNGKYRYIFSCSGASDVGAIADFAVRSLARDYSNKMGCLSCVGAGGEKYMRDVRDATRIVVIDGCDDDCARKNLENTGLKINLHIRLTDEGFSKGRNASTPLRVNSVVKLVTDRMRGLDKSH